MVALRAGGVSSARIGKPATPTGQGEGHYTLHQAPVATGLREVQSLSGGSAVTGVAFVAFVAAQHLGLTAQFARSERPLDGGVFVGFGGGFALGRHGSPGMISSGLHKLSGNASVPPVPL